MLGFVIAAAVCFACSSSGTARSPPSAADGETIDLDLIDVELTDALATLAGKASINLFAGPELAADRVSLSLHAVQWRDALARIAADHQLRVETLDVRGVDRPVFWISKQSSSGAPVTSFSGQQITARFDDAPIREVTQALAEVAHTPITVDDDVQVTVTLHLRLPWDLALYHLAQKYNLRIVQENGAVRIRQPTGR
jgi:type II secretory pathway component GspD/PulD (secretin)